MKRKEIHLTTLSSPLPGRAVQHHSLTAESANRELWKNKTLARDREDTGYEEGI